jgi:hypothetical protein
MKIHQIAAALALFTITSLTEDCTILACALLAARY